MSAEVDVLTTLTSPVEQDGADSRGPDPRPEVKVAEETQEIPLALSAACHVAATLVYLLLGGLIFRHYERPFELLTMEETVEINSTVCVAEDIILSIFRDPCFYNSCNLLMPCKIICGVRCAQVCSSSPLQ